MVYVLAQVRTELLADLKTYQEKFTTHNAAVKQTCERHGIQFHPVVSNQPLEFALFDFMRSRGQRARNVRRRVLR